MTTDGGARDTSLDAAVAAGQLIDSARSNITTLLASAPTDIYARSVDELIAASAWSEFNDRFCKTLAFGAGGVRGRTIGKIVSAAGGGDAGDGKLPRFPCVGANAMNFYDID